MVIAPLSTLDHWKQVFEQWTYFNVVTYHDMGGARGRATLRHNEWYFTDVTRTGLLTKKAQLVKFNVLITSYEIFALDFQYLKLIPF